MAKTPTTAATKALQQELKSLQKEPLEGFTVQLINDNLFEWEVAIFGMILIPQPSTDSMLQSLLFKFKSKNLKVLQTPCIKADTLNRA